MKAFVPGAGAEQQQVRGAVDRHMCAAIVDVHAAQWACVQVDGCVRTSCCACACCPMRAPGWVCVYRAMNMCALHIEHVRSRYRVGYADCHWLCGWWLCAASGRRCGCRCS